MSPQRGVLDGAHKLMAHVNVAVGAEGPVPGLRSSVAARRSTFGHQI